MNDARDQIFVDESVRLDDTVQVVKTKRDDLEKEITSLGAVNLDTLKKLRQDAEAGLDLIFALQKLHESNQAYNLPDKYAQLEELTHSIDEPYFARIDIVEQNSTPDKIYIGKFGVVDKNRPVVTDWRTKIASIYYKYRYPQKNVVYETSDGPIKADLILKRTFEIDKGQLIKYYNNDIQFDENTIISQKIQERTGGTLEDIIETIQEGQLEIIESDPRQTCIVQGCVGSGKSTVAIHKLAYIFFNYPSLIHAQRSILIAKNQILVSYLSTLFPKLGIFDINYKTIRDLLVQIIYKENLKITFDFDKADTISAFGLSEINSLREDIANLHSKYEYSIKKMFEQPEFESFGGFVYNAKDAISLNLRELEQELNEEIDLQREYSKNTNNSLRKELHKENIKTVRKILSKITKLKNDLKSDFAKILHANKINSSESLTYSQGLIYVYLHHELFGFENFLKFEYCVVDEGQDVSILEYLVLGKLVLNGRFCILGDLNQSYDQAGLTDWDSIAKVIVEAKTANVFELGTNYRSTKNIINFANSILAPYTSNYLPQPIERIGKEPSTETFTNIQELTQKLNTSLLHDSKELTRSVGIIIFDESLYSEVEAHLPQSIKESDHFITLDSNKPIRYIPKGIYLSKFKDCKGLEFSKVYVIGLDTQKIHNFTQAKAVFVAVTRAMNEVVIMNSQNNNARNSN
jgi:DNA helicase-2/ATP-dependent DNA helicase PcrA